MKQIIVSLIKNPIIFGSVALTVALCGISVIVLTRRNNALVGLFESLSIRFLILCQSELMLTPFVHWNTLYLIVPPNNNLITASQGVIYIYIITALFPKINRFLRSHFRKFLFKALLNNPFIWILSVLAIISCLWSETPLVALKGGLVLLGINLVSLYISACYSWNKIFGFIRWNIATIGLLSFVVRRRTNAGTTESGGLAGVLPSKNTLGGIMVLGAILWILHTIGNRKQRPISIVMSCVCLLMAVQAKSGGAIFLFIVLLFATLSTRFLKSFRFKYAAVMTSGFLLVATAALFLVFINLESALGAVGKDLSFTGRSKVWPAVLSAASERVWLGYGMFSFWQPWRGLDNPALDHWTGSFWVPPSAHQGFLDTLLQIGLVGLISLFLCIGLSTIQSIRYLFTHKGVPAVLPITVILHHFMSNLPETRVLRPNAFWVAYVLVSIKLSISVDRSIAPSEEALTSMGHEKVLEKV